MKKKVFMFDGLCVTTQGPVVVVSFDSNFELVYPIAIPRYYEVMDMAIDAISGKKFHHVVINTLRRQSVGIINVSIDKQHAMLNPIIVKGDYSYGKKYPNVNATCIYTKDINVVGDDIAYTLGVGNREVKVGIDSNDIFSFK